MKQILGWKEIPQSETLKAYLQKLKQGVCVITRVKNAESTDGVEKVQIEFAEKLGLSSGGNSAAGLLNVGVKGFTSGAQHCWMTAVADQAKAIFGIEVPEGQASVEVMKAVPQYEGLDFRMQLTEVLESQLNDNQKEYADSYLKRAGAEGNYFYAANGERVASLKRIVTVNKGEEPIHTQIEGSYTPASTAMSNILRGNTPALSSDVANAGG